MADSPSASSPLAGATSESSDTGDSEDDESLVSEPGVSAFSFVDTPNAAAEVSTHAFHVVPTDEVAFKAAKSMICRLGRPSFSLQPSMPGSAAPSAAFAEVCSWLLREVPQGECSEQAVPIANFDDISHARTLSQTSSKVILLLTSPTVIPTLPRGVLPVVVSWEPSKPWQLCVDAEAVLWGLLPPDRPERGRATSSADHPLVQSLLSPVLDDLAALSSQRVVVDTAAFFRWFQAASNQVCEAVNPKGSRFDWTPARASLGGSTCSPACLALALGHVAKQLSQEPFVRPLPRRWRMAEPIEPLFRVEAEQLSLATSGRKEHFDEALEQSALLSKSPAATKRPRSSGTPISIRHRRKVFRTTKSPEHDSLSQLAEELQAQAALETASELSLATSIAQGL